MSILYSRSTTITSLYRYRYPSPVKVVHSPVTRLFSATAKRSASGSLAKTTSQPVETAWALAASWRPSLRDWERIPWERLDPALAGWRHCETAPFQIFQTTCAQTGSRPHVLPCTQILVVSNSHLGFVTVVGRPVPKPSQRLEWLESTRQSFLAFCCAGLSENGRSFETDFGSIG
jgi:hypothetical protein